MKTRSPAESKSKSKNDATPENTSKDLAASSSEVISSGDIACNSKAVIKSTQKKGRKETRKVLDTDIPTAVKLSITSKKRKKKIFDSELDDINRTSKITNASLAIEKSKLLNIKVSKNVSKNINKKRSAVQETLPGTNDKVTLVNKVPTPNMRFGSFTDEDKKIEKNSLCLDEYNKNYGTKVENSPEEKLESPVIKTKSNIRSKIPILILNNFLKPSDSDVSYAGYDDTLQIPSRTSAPELLATNSTHSRKRKRVPGHHCLDLDTSVIQQQGNNFKITVKVNTNKLPINVDSNLNEEHKRTCSKPGDKTSSYSQSSKQESEDDDCEKLPINVNMNQNYTVKGHSATSKQISQVHEVETEKNVVKPSFLDVEPEKTVVTASTTDYLQETIDFVVTKYTRESNKEHSGDGHQSSRFPYVRLEKMSFNEDMKEMYNLKKKLKSNTHKKSMKSNNDLRSKSDSVLIKSNHNFYKYKQLNISSDTVTSIYSSKDLNKKIANTEKSTKDDSTFLSKTPEPSMESLQDKSSTYTANISSSNSTFSICGNESNIAQVNENSRQEKLCLNEQKSTEHMQSFKNINGDLRNSSSSIVNSSIIESNSAQFTDEETFKMNASKRKQLISMADSSTSSDDSSVAVKKRKLLDKSYTDVFVHDYGVIPAPLNIKITRNISTNNSERIIQLIPQPQFHNLDDIEEHESTPACTLDYRDYEEDDTCEDDTREDDTCEDDTCDDYSCDDISCNSWHNIYYEFAEDEIMRILSYDQIFNGAVLISSNIHNITTIPPEMTSSLRSVETLEYIDKNLSSPIDKETITSDDRVNQLQCVVENRSEFPCASRNIAQDSLLHKTSSITSADIESDISQEGNFQFKMPSLPPAKRPPTRIRSYRSDTSSNRSRSSEYSDASYTTMSASNSSGTSVVAASLNFQSYPYVQENDDAISLYAGTIKESDFEEQPPSREILNLTNQGQLNTLTGNAPKNDIMKWIESTEEARQLLPSTAEVERLTTTTKETGYLTPNNEESSHMISSNDKARHLISSKEEARHLISNNDKARNLIPSNEEARHSISTNKEARQMMQSNEAVRHLVPSNEKHLISSKEVARHLIPSSEEMKSVKVPAVFRNLCLYYYRGDCKFKNNCRRTHNLNNIQAKKIENLSYEDLLVAYRFTKDKPRLYTATVTIFISAFRQLGLVSEILNLVKDFMDIKLPRIVDRTPYIIETIIALKRMGLSLLVSVEIIVAQHNNNISLSDILLYVICVQYKVELNENWCLVQKLIRHRNGHLIDHHIVENIMSECCNNRNIELSKNLIRDIIIQNLVNLKAVSVSKLHDFISFLHHMNCAEEESQLLQTMRSYDMEITPLMSDNRLSPILQTVPEKRLPDHNSVCNGSNLTQKSFVPSDEYTITQNMSAIMLDPLGKNLCSVERNSAQIDDLKNDANAVNFLQNQNTFSTRQLQNPYRNDSNRISQNTGTRWDRPMVPSKKSLSDDFDPNIYGYSNATDQVISQQVDLGNVMDQNISNSADIQYDVAFPAGSQVNPNYLSLISSDSSTSSAVTSFEEEYRDSSEKCLTESDIKILSDIIANEKIMEFLDMFNIYKDTPLSESFVVNIIGLFKRKMPLDIYNLASKIINTLEQQGSNFIDEEDAQKMIHMLVVNIIALLEQQKSFKEAAQLLLKFRGQLLNLTRIKWFKSIHKYGYSEIGKYLHFCRIFLKGGCLREAADLLMSPELKLLYGSNMWTLQCHENFDLEYRNKILEDLITTALKTNITIAKDVILNMITDKNQIIEIGIWKYFNRLILEMQNRGEDFVEDLKQVLPNIIQGWYKYLTKPVMRGLLMKLTLCNTSNSELIKLYRKCCKRKIYPCIKGNEYKLCLTTDMTNEEIYMTVHYFFTKIVAGNFPLHEVTLTIKLSNSESSCPKMLQSPNVSVDALKSRICKVLASSFKYAINVKISETEPYIKISSDQIRQCINHYKRAKGILTCSSYWVRQINVEQLQLKEEVPDGVHSNTD